MRNKCAKCELYCYGRGLCYKHYSALPDVIARRNELNKKRYSTEKGTAQRLASMKKYEQSEKGKKGRAIRAAARYQRDKKLGLVTDRSYFIGINVRYGLTKQVYLDMLCKQGGACAICNQTSTKRLFVDHCHATGIVRGLLCIRCNSVIGHAVDSVDVLQLAIRYLLASKERQP